MIIDDRDGSREFALTYPLSELAVLSRLESGDVSITGNGPDDSILAVGVEVKSLSDLLQSMANGRLGDQLTQLTSAYDQSWLLTYGEYRAHPGSGDLQVARGQRWRSESRAGRPLPVGYLEGALLTYTAAGVHHKHVEDEVQAAFWLACLEKWWYKPWSEHRAFHKFNRAGDLSIIPDIAPDMLQRMRIAADLPGVGWERALAAAVSFTSVRAMINATESQWCDVPGIGKVIARAIVRAVS